MLELDQTQMESRLFDPAQAFSKNVEYIVEAGLEIDNIQIEQIKQAGEEFIDSLEIDTEFFNNEAGSFLFIALANEYALLRAEEGSMRLTEYTDKKSLLMESAALLAGEHSVFAPLTREDGAAISEEGRLAVYDKYTNIDVSKELEGAIKDGDLFSDVKSRMGITNENEQDYEIRVLNISSEDAHSSYGMAPTIPEALKDGDFSDPEYRHALDKHFFDADLFNAYDQGLNDKGDKFRSEISMHGTPPAWVTVVEGKTFLCVPLPNAEKILYTDETRSGYYTSDDHDRELAFLEHEYVHTQNMVLPDARASLGISLEELRAEHYSGDKHGYTSIKRHFMFTSVATGYSPKNTFDEYGQGNPYSPLKFYTSMANEIGLDGVLDAAMVIPESYLNDGAPEILKSVNNRTGGIDGVQKKIWDKIVARGGEKQALTELNKLADTLLDRRDVIAPSSYLNYSGASFFSKMVEEIVKNKEAAEVNQQT